MYCPNCGNATELQVTELQVISDRTELQVISDRKDFEEKILSPVFCSFNESFEKPPVFFNLDVSDLESFLIEKVELASFPEEELEGLDRRGDVFQTVTVWKRDEKVYLDKGEYLRYLREPM